MACQCPQGGFLLWSEEYSSTSLHVNKADQAQSWALCEVPWSYKACSHQKKIRISLFLFTLFSRVGLFPNPWTVAHQAFLSFTISWNWLKLIRVHWVDDAIQPSHSLSSPSLAPSLSSEGKHQGLLQWVGSSHQLAKVLELQLQHQSFQWIFRTDFLWDWLVWSPCNLRDSQESSPMKFKSINSLALSLLNGPIFTSVHDYQKNHSFDYMDLCQQTDVSAF